MEGRPQRTKSQRTSRSIHLADVDPGSGSNSNDVTFPDSPASVSSAGRAHFQSHSRTMSTMSVTTDASNPRSNRFSTQFPIQPVVEADPQLPTSPGQEVVPEVNAPPSGPTDNGFLTAIATQERKVLELKEELQKAEGDLNRLKKQWVSHEAQRKRNDARKVTKLQPLNTRSATQGAGPSPVIGGDDEDGSNAWLQQEMERRKALMQASRHSGRTVFSGSRHTRTLSLLSPTTTESPMSSTSRPQRQDSLHDRSSQDSSAPPSRPQFLSRASTTPDLTNVVAADNDADINLDSPNPIDREMLIRTGKKMASGFRDGLWTFIEDLRQATVGDEAVQTIYPGNTPSGGPRRQASAQTLKGSRRQSRRASLRQGQQSEGKKASHLTAGSNSEGQISAQGPTDQAPLVDVGGVFWQDNGVVSTPKKKVSTKHSKSYSKASATSSNQASADESAWDLWPDSSPAPSALESRSSSAASNLVSTPRTSDSSTAETARDPSDQNRKESNRDSIPWPAITKLGPAQLKRTASHLMGEWERSLSPGTGQEWKGEQGDFLGMSAEAAATAASTSKSD